MTKHELHIKLISISLLLASLFSVIFFPGPYTSIMTSLQNTTMWWVLIVSTYAVFISYIFSYVSKEDKINVYVIIWYLTYIWFTIFRGLFVAETYWDWKGFISNSFGLLVPIFAIVATNVMVLQSMLSFYVRYTLPLFVLVAFAITFDAYGFYLVPISFFMLFFPVLTTRWKVIVIFLSILVMTIDLGARSNVIKFGVPVMIMSIYYFRKYITIRYLEGVRWFLMLIPIVLFTLAVSGVFNVFESGNNVKGDYSSVQKDDKGNLVDSDLKADTRTFLYVEVLYTAKVFNSWILGRTPVRGSLSDWFGEDDENGRGERLGNEVAILNVFTWTGLVGVVLYFFVFFRASYVAINISNNIYSKMLGLSIAFRWAYAWVEDINYYTLTTVFLWLTIGLCFSKTFRLMTDEEVSYWVKGIFDKQFAQFYRAKMLEEETKEV